MIVDSSALVAVVRVEPDAARYAAALVAANRPAISAVTAAQASIARQAYRDFGRGSGSPARLNFGDCFAYALAAQRREPLLFKGADFTHTDLVAADIPDQ
ncbi:type II toxin-antitoxin system VapC family toxin [Frankia sp. Cas4]|uniref:type II toxin-antitoxin system VapC family toxin n=1 Tax=Frankia sp. Cas4 TaxID=3073927 RepID=UPI002AD544D4|nr:type II toxin-antitoxin system VapC family toxin [Frankia sp. Cas4]